MSSYYISDKASVSWVCLQVFIHLSILFSLNVAVLYFDMPAVNGVVIAFFTGAPLLYALFAYMQLSKPMFEVDSEVLRYRNFFRFGVQEFLLADMKEVSIEGNKVKATIKGKIVSMQFPESIRESVVKMLEKFFQITLSG